MSNPVHSGGDAPPPYEEATHAKKEEFVPFNSGYGDQPASPMRGNYQTGAYSGYPQGSAYPPQGPPYPAGQGGYAPGGYAPGGYGPVPTGGQQTVIIQQPTIAFQQFSELPVQTVCPSCQASVETGVLYESGTLTWVACVVLCLVGCDAGCCLIPFCVDSCKDAVHVCPNCHKMIGRYTRL